MESCGIQPEPGGFGIHRRTAGSATHRGLSIQATDIYIPPGGATAQPKNRFTGKEHTLSVPCTTEHGFEDNGGGECLVCGLANDSPDTNHRKDDGEAEAEREDQETFDIFVEDATHLVADKWDACGYMPLDDKRTDELNDLLTAFFQDKR
jgi:hypothetical protein